MPPILMHHVAQVEYDYIPNIMVRAELEWYRRTGFKCEYLLIANCEFFKTLQLIDSQE